MALTVADTGPTGEIGTSVVRALEQERRVDRVLGMARRPFDPASRGWRKTEYRQGDVLDPAAVAAFVAEADVVVHLAYVIVGSREESQRINLAGTRNVFEATVSADRPRRLVYTWSLPVPTWRSTCCDRASWPGQRQRCWSGACRGAGPPSACPVWHGGCSAAYPASLCFPTLVCASS